MDILRPPFLDRGQLAHRNINATSDLDLKKAVSRQSKITTTRLMERRDGVPLRKLYNSP